MAGGEVMNRKLQKIIFALTLILALLPQVAFADTIEEYLNNMVGAKKLYDTDLSPVYLKTNTTEETISQVNGELSLAQTDFYLPGRNGMNLEIKRLYSSGISNVKEMKVKYVNGAWVDYVYSDEKTSSFFEDRYNVGIGMRLSFPTIEIRTNGDGSSYKFLHTETGDSYKLSNPIYEVNSVKYNIEGQTVKDVVVYENTTFSNGQTDGTSKYLMTGKDGKKTYFAVDGRILGIVDRYGNTIKFEYTTLSYTVNNYTKTKRLISKITDTIGRVVEIEYKEDHSFKVKPISNPTYSQEESYKASQNPNDNYSGDLEGKFQVIFKLPGNKTIVYDKSAVLVSDATQQVIRTRIQRVFDTDEKIKYHFWYEQPDLGFTYSNGSTYGAYNRYENITQINNYKTNKLTKYVYSTFTKDLSDGSMQYRKIFEKKDIAKTGYDATKGNFLDRYTGTIVNKVTYGYTNEPDGYGFAGYNAGNDDYLKNTYRFYTEKTEMNGAKVKYTYDGAYKMINYEEYGNDHKEIVTTVHDEMKLTKKTERLIYNVVNGQVVGNPIKKIENYRYDAYGNLTNYTGPLAKRDSDGYPIDNEYMVVYSYDIEKFHQPILKTWKKDANTTSQISYTLDAKGNVIQEKRLHVDNGDKSILTDFVYDSYGNMTKKTVHSSENDYVTNYEYGTDKDGVNHKGAYLTREYSVLNGTEISKGYVYDYNTGNIKAEIDANNNRTSYEYDLLSRVTKEIYPDLSTKLYKYIDTWNEDKKNEITDQKGNVSSYSYDIQGNMVKYSVLDNGTWKTVSTLQYDGNGNKLKETDSRGNSIRFEYNSQNKLISKSYWEKDTTEKARASFKYAYAPDANTFKMITATDEEGYQTRMHYDVAGRLIAVESTPDKVNYYTRTIGYDYEGNTVVSKDNKNNTTQYVYDDLQRLVKIIDPLDNVTQFSYNSLDKLVKKIEPGDKVTEYVLDLIGRVKEEKVYKLGENNHTYTSFIYDNLDNITGRKTGMFVNGVDKPASEETYVYDNMNRVTDEYAKIDSIRKSHSKHVYDKNGNKLQTTEYLNAAEDRFIRHNYEYDYADRRTLEEGFIQDGADSKRGYFQSKFTYDVDGNQLTRAEFNGSGYNTSKYEYDYANRIVRKEEPFKEAGVNKVITLSYDKKGNLVSEVFTKQGVECEKKYEYDGMGNLIRFTDELGNTTRYVYDANKNKIKEIDPRYYSIAKERSNPAILNSAPHIAYEYDALGRPIKTTTYDGNSTIVIAYTEYDGRGNVIKQVDGAGYNSTNPEASMGTILEYDILDRVTKQISAETANYNKLNAQNKFSIRYTYDAAGRVLTEEDANGNITTNSYYLNGLLKEKTYPDDIKESYDYDFTGKVETVKTDRGGNVTRLYNNVFGKPYKIVYPDNSVESFEYGFNGMLLTSTDKAGVSKQYKYDAAGNLISRMEPYKTDGDYSYYRLEESTYDETGNVLTKESFDCKKAIGSSADPTKVSAGDLTTFAYDKASRIIKVTGPLQKAVISEYDAKGNLVLVKERVYGDYYDVKRYSYDVLSRPIEETLLVESSALDSAYLSGAEFDTTFSSRVKVKTTYTYYNNGTLKSRTDAKENTTLYTYDYDGRTKQITDPLENKIFYKYDLNGNVVEEINAVNASTVYEYDKMGRVIRKKSPSADGSIAVTRYVYDAMGNVVKQINPNAYIAELDTADKLATMSGMSYEFDRMNRLVVERNPEGKATKYVKYDVKGNVSKVVDGLRYNGDINTSQGTEYTYDLLNRVIRTADAAGNITTFEYDIQDNITKKVDGRNNSTTFKYNADNTLREVIFPNNGALLYEYDYLGRKIKETDQNKNETSYEYNAFGLQKTVKDAYDKIQDFRYDRNGNLTSHKDQNGYISKLKYDGNNRLIEKRLPIEQISGGFYYSIESYIYNGIGNVISKTLTGTKDPTSKRITNYTYYKNGLVETASDNSGRYTKNYYDKNGNLIKSEILRDKGIYDITKYEYDAQDRMTKSINLIDEENIYTASSMPNISGLRDKEYSGKVRIITGYEYDLLGNKTKVISPKAYQFVEEADKAEYITSYLYDVLNRVQKITRKHNGIDVSIQYSYDQVGNKTKEVNEKGYITTLEYDAMNRLVRTVDPMGYDFTYGYDLVGNKTTVTNAKGDTISYTYDKLNRAVEIKDPYEVVISRKVYDAKGYVIKEIDAKGYLSASTDAERYGRIINYSPAGKVVSITDAENNTTFNEYDQFGQLIKVTDPMNNQTKYQYDAAGNLIKVTDPLEISVRYTRDKLGNKTSMTDGRNKVTQYRYGNFGLLLTYTDAEGKSSNYKYDLLLKTAEMKDRNNKSTLYEYDNRGLLTSSKVAGTPLEIGYTYDELGNKASMTDATGVTNYSYNKNNWLVSISKNGHLQLSYELDQIGNITSVTDKTNFTTTYSYDKSSRMETVSFNGKTTTYEYDQNGNRILTSYEGSSKESYTFDKNNKLLTLTNTTAAGVPISSYSYTYDKAGKQTSKIDDFGTTSYSYDKAGRITKVVAPGKTTIYAYDNSGNRTAMEEAYTSEQTMPAVDGTGTNEIKYSTKKSDYVYSNAGRLLKLVETMKDASGKELMKKQTTYRHDNNGNELSRAVEFVTPYNNLNPKAYSAVIYGQNSTEPINHTVEKTNSKYDGFNRLVSMEIIKSGARTTVEYTYNGDDLRIKKVVRKSTNNNIAEATNYLYDRQHVILETDANEGIKTRYVRGLNYIARMDNAGNTSYFLFNGHGDVVQTVSEAGEVQNRYDYDIFGNPTLSIEQQACAIRYAGEYYDAETGMYYLRARYYDPYIGRFISEDSYWGEDNNPLSLNLYTYAHNDPIKYIDPTGHRVEVEYGGGSSKPKPAPAPKPEPKSSPKASPKPPQHERASKPEPPAKPAPAPKPEPKPAPEPAPKPAPKEAPKPATVKDDVSAKVTKSESPAKENAPAKERNEDKGSSSKGNSSGSGNTSSAPKTSANNQQARVNDKLLKLEQDPGTSTAKPAPQPALKTNTGGASTAGVGTTDGKTGQGTGNGPISTQTPINTKRGQTNVNSGNPHQLTPEAAKVQLEENIKAAYVAKEAGLGTVQIVGGGFEAAFGSTVFTASMSNPITALPGGAAGSYVVVDGVSNVFGGLSRVKNAFTGSSAGDEWNFMKNIYKSADPVNGEDTYNATQVVIGGLSLTKGTLTMASSVKIAGVESSNLIKYTGTGLNSLPALTTSNIIDAYNINSAEQSIERSKYKGGNKNGSR